MNATALAPIVANVAGTSPELHGDTGVVEQDDFAVLGETIGHRRIPMVHGAGDSAG